MWTLSFQPYSDGQTVGIVTAIFNKGLLDQFVFTGSVNLADTTGKLAFVVMAKLALAKSKAPLPVAVSSALSAMTAGLNL